MNEALPNAFVSGYVHLAKLPCFSCDGTGMVQGYLCGLCLGSANYTAGCGGAAEVDVNHFSLSHCVRCGFVPNEEVTAKEAWQ